MPEKDSAIAKALTVAGEYVPEYVPKALRPAELEPREQITYAIGDEQKPGSFAMWLGPTLDIGELLEVVPDREHTLVDGLKRMRTNSCIIRFNLDGTDTILYRWKTFTGKSNQSPRWVCVVN